MKNFKSRLENLEKAGKRLGLGRDFAIELFEIAMKMDCTIPSSADDEVEAARCAEILKPLTEEKKSLLRKNWRSVKRQLQSRE